MSDSEPKGWPARVIPVRVADLGRLGIDGNNRLYWDGKRIEVQRRLTLTRLQKAVTGVVSVFAVLGGLGGFVTGLNNASLFLCARGVHWLTCPVPPGP